MIVEDRFSPPSADEDDNVYAMFSRPNLVHRIGDDLRGFYGDVACSVQPDYLIELANRIDDRRRSEGNEG